MGEAVAARQLWDTPSGLKGRGRVSFPRLLNQSGAASKGLQQAPRRPPARLAGDGGAGTGRVKLATVGEQPAGMEAGGQRGQRIQPVMVPVDTQDSTTPNSHRNMGLPFVGVPSTHVPGPSTERAGRLCHQQR